MLSTMPFKLYILLQRYNFESNTQLVVPTKIRQNSCIFYCKDTILKAIHNDLIKKALNQEVDGEPLI